MPRKGRKRKGPEEALRRIQEAADAGSTALDLSELGLKTLPPSLPQLSNLQELYLTGNQLTQLPQDFANLSNLQRLYLASNQLTQLPQDFANLSNLQTLFLHDNQLTQLPQNFANLSNLQELYLYDNQLTQLPQDFANLSNLQTLFLHDNQLTQLPQNFANLSNLQTLVLSGNQLPDALMAAYNRGIPELFAYLRSLEKPEEVERLYEAKLVLVGEGNVGKTCLRDALRGRKFIKDRPTTHGIEIRKLQLPHPQAKGPITFNIWDFGGQEVYRVTYQFFFSPRSLYLVVWYPREGAKRDEVEGWIKRIRLRVGDEARILVVSTHCQTGERFARIDKQELRQAFGEIIAGFYEVDSETGAGIEELKHVIAKAASTLPQMGDPFSKKWTAARDEVLRLAQPKVDRKRLEASCKDPELSTTGLALVPPDGLVTDEFVDFCEENDIELEKVTTPGRPRMAYTQFRTVCKKHGLPDDATRTLASLMHILGHVIYYADDDGLKEEVILQPEWLTKAIGFVLEDKKTNQDCGELDHSRLIRIWHDDVPKRQQRYDPKFHRYFLRLMEKHDVSYRLEGGTRSLVAQLVPEVRPKLPWTPHAASDKPQLRLVCQMDDAPPGLVPWMIVRTHHFATDPRRHWQGGMYLEHQLDGTALLELRQRELTFDVRAAYPAHFTSILSDSLTHLIEQRWPGLEYSLALPCPLKRDGSPCKGRLKLQVLGRRLARGSFLANCPECGEDLDIGTLLRHFEKPSEEHMLDLVLKRLDDASAERKRLIERLEETAEAASEERRRYASHAAELVRIMLQAVSTETRECPRLFTLLTENLSIWNPANIGKVRHRLTLWCEMPGREHPTCKIGSAKKGSKEAERGEYIFPGSKEWLARIAPYASLVARTLRTLVPLAGAGLQATLDETLLKEISPKLDLMEKSAATFLKGDFDAPRSPDLEGGLHRREEGAGLRELRSLLLELDPKRKWGNLRRVLTPTGEYLWLCPEHYPEYDPGLPKL